MMWEVLLDTLVDSVKIFPFLLLTYILMEYLEHKTSSRTNHIVGKAGRLGPVIGGIVGAVPQCGFSAAASNLYAGRVITLGTLLAIFLSTSDEMLPVMISEQCSISIIVKILVSKIVIAIIVGLAADALVHYIGHGKQEENITHLCEHEHCHCERGIVRSALKHSVQILFFIFCVTLILNSVIAFVGEEQLKAFAARGSVIGIFLAALVGLIPNCAASVVITQLYLEQIISTSAMMAGLLVGSGVGILVLFRMNHHLKENLKIVAIMYVTGVVFGLLFEVAGFSFL
jgi:hypothetical protein